MQIGVFAVGLPLAVVIQSGIGNICKLSRSQHRTTGHSHCDCAGIMVWEAREFPSRRTARRRARPHPGAPWSGAGL